MHPNIYPLTSFQLFCCQHYLKTNKKKYPIRIVFVCVFLGNPQDVCWSSSRVHLSFDHLLHLLLLCVQATRPSVWAEHYLTKGRTKNTIVLILFSLQIF